MASVDADPPRYWTAGRTALATLVLAGVAAVFAALFYLQAAVFCLFFGIIVATALRRPIGWLERRGLQRGTAVVVVFGGLAIVLIAALGVGIPVLANQAIDLRDKLPKFYDAARQRLLDSSGGVIHQLLAQSPAKLPWLSLGGAGQRVSLEFVPPAIRYLGEVLSVVLLIAATLMLAFYWALQEERTLRGLLMLVSVSRRDSARELIEAMQAKVGDYVFGQATVCCVIGLLTLTAYSLIRLPHAFPLAILSGLLEAVPVFGLLVSALPAALVALSISGGKFFALIVAIAAIHLSDNFFISPKIMGRSVGLHPFVTLLALVAFGELFGLPGAIMAILLASIAQLLLDRFLLSREAQAVAPVAGRDHISLLRHEVQEVLHDARLCLRRKEEASTPSNDHFEDAIERIAGDLEELLSAEFEHRSAGHGETEAGR